MLWDVALAQIDQSNSQAPSNAVHQVESLSFIVIILRFSFVEAVELRDGSRLVFD